jgi:hypothetical protein
MASPIDLLRKNSIPTCDLRYHALAKYPFQLEYDFTNHVGYHDSLWIKLRSGNVLLRCRNHEQHSEVIWTTDHCDKARVTAYIKYSCTRIRTLRQPIGLPAQYRTRIQVYSTFTSNRATLRGPCDQANGFHGGRLRGDNCQTYIHRQRIE